MIYTAAESLLIIAMLLGIGVLLTDKRRLSLALIAQSYLVWAAFGIYVIAHIVADNQLLHVSGVGAKEHGIFYRVSGIWSDHAGSWFLWVALISGIGSKVLHAEGVRLFSRRVLLIQMANLIYLLSVLNPFTKNESSNIQGVLNPLLHDISLGIHPPILYVGTLMMMVSCLGLMHRPSNRHYMSFMKIGWAIHTVGITLGSIWAYYELGWGGWWFWDPVENMSLMPWLLGIFLVHPHKNLFVRVQVVSLLIVVAILVGVWLVRSGLVQSVHSFAHDAKQVRLLGMTLGVQVLIALWGMQFVDDSGRAQPWQRWQGWMVGIVIAILTATIDVPVIVGVVWQKMVGFTPAFFTYVVGSLMLVSVSGIIYFYTDSFHSLRNVILAGVLVILLGLTYCPGNLVELVAVGVGLGVLIQTLRCWKNISWGALSAHVGVGVMALAIGLNAILSFDVTREISRTPARVGRSQIQLVRQGEAHTSAHHKRHAVFRVTKNGFTCRLIPYFQHDKRTNITVSKTSLHPYDLGLMMVSYSATEMHERSADSNTVTAYIRVDPFVGLIWFGAFLIGFGVLCLFRKRNANIV